MSSARLYDLIERFFSPRRGSRQAVYDLQHVTYPAIRRLAKEHHPSAEKSDKAWLQRIELRQADSVIAVLEANGLREQPGAMHALFVDGRCGFIGSFEIGGASALERDSAVGEILAEASNCHADGIILATNDLGGKLADGPQWSKLVSDLYHKGEATEIFLLDHFVLTTCGWTRMFNLSGRERR